MRFAFIFIVSFYISPLLAQSITGNWYGLLNVQTTKLPLVLHIQQTKDSLTATLDSPAQGVTGMKTDRATFTNKELYIEIKNIRATYKAHFGGNSLSGVFTQSGTSLPLAFTRKEIHSDSLSPQKQITAPTNLKAASHRVDSLINYLVANNRLAGGVSIFKNGKEIYRKTFGQDSLSMALQTKQTFQIGSVTKTMTAAMIYQLAEEKKLSLADKLSKYYPQIPAADSITIHQLLNHSSGLGDYVIKPDNTTWLIKPATENDIIQTIISQGILFTPGTDQRYSNSGYWLLTGILKKVTGKTYAQNLAARVLQPVGMKNTFAAEDNPTNVFPSFNYYNSWKIVEDFYFKNVIGVGDVAATPADMNRFINALFAEKIISAQSLANMKPVGKRMGHGLFIVPFGNIKFYGHSGGTYGTNSLMIYNPLDSIAITYSCNASRIAINDFAIYLLSAFYNVDFKYPVFAKACTPTVSELNALAGNYASAIPPIQLNIFVKDSLLFGQVKGQGAFPLSCYEKNKFEFKMADVKIHFEPQTATLKLLQNGATITLQKSTK